jgi:integral membrane protein (TIGR01906 family)
MYMEEYTMSTHKAAATVFGIIAGILFFLLAVSVSVTFILHLRAIYYADISLLHIPENSGYSVDLIRRNYDVLIDYNTIGFKGPLAFPDLAMSESGRIHFEEVKRVFDLFGYMAIILTPVCAVCLFISRKLRSALCLLVGGILGLAVPVILAILTAVSWDTFFVKFHQLVFRNDFWIFDWRTDPVILILPDTFFLHCAVLIFALVFLFSIVMLILYKVSRIKLRYG